MKITHLIFSLRTGGTENMLIDIINEQVLHAEIALYIVNDQVNYDLLKRLNKKAKIKQFNRKPGSKNPLPLISLNVALLKENSNIIHCHNHNMIEVLLPVFHKRTILTIHTTGIKPANFSKYIQCVSISYAVQNDIFSLSKIDTKVITNGITFNTIKSKRQLDIGKDTFNILQISSLNHQKKGQHIAIEAIKLLKDNGFNHIHLDFIGEGSSDQYLKELSKEKGVDDHVNFLGLRDRLYIYENLRHYDLLIQPSFHEGFGLTIVEAMAAKVPVLVSAIEGPMEIIQAGEYGNKFEKGNAAELADKVIEIMGTNREYIKTVTERAYAYAKVKFDIKNTALNYLDEYQRHA